MHPLITVIDKGRYAWDSENKAWTIKYRPFYEQWVALLRMVNPLIYAPLPKLVVPKKIKAQYETQEVGQPKSFTNYYGKSEANISDKPDPVMQAKEKFEVCFFIKVYNN